MNPCYSSSMLLWQFHSIIKADVKLFGYATLCQTGKCGKIKQPEFICKEETFLSGPRNIPVSTCVCVNLMCRSGCPTSCLQHCRIAELVDHKRLIYFCPCCFLLLNKKIWPYSLLKRSLAIQIILYYLHVVIDLHCMKTGSVPEAALSLPDNVNQC